MQTAVIDSLSQLDNKKSKVPAMVEPLKWPHICPNDDQTNTISKMKMFRFFLKKFHIADVNKNNMAFYA